MSVQVVDINGKPTIISIFAGCGGSSLGYQWAGFNELLAIDNDKNAAETFKLNFLNVPIWQKDIKMITAKEILKFCNLKKGQLDVLDGSPPCQGFSTAGKRQVNDNRNDLSYEYIRLIKGLQPKVFVMENVSGMAKGKMKGKFIEIMKALKETGYNVKCKLMNSMYYEVPQSRERLIWIGVKNGEPRYPKPLDSIISIRDAIGKNGFIRYRHNYSKGKVHFKDSSFNKPCLTITKKGQGWTVYYDTKGQFRKKAISDSNVMPTITKNNSYHLKVGIEKETSRLFTIEEALILSSFPKNYKLQGTFSKQWAGIGNAVMPKFMEHIARTIKTEILNYA